LNEKAAKVVEACIEKNLVRLRLEFEEQVAIDKMRKKLEMAPTRLKTRFKNVVHGFATGDVFN